MGERTDPARTGFKAGRVVGVLTAVLVVVSLFLVRERFVGRLESMVRFVGISPGPSVEVYFHLYVAGAAVTRYGISYIVGALIGVVYDWLDRPSLPVLAALVVPVGVADGLQAALDTRSVLIGVAYLLAWLLYIPMFYRNVDDEGSYQEGPVRFNDS